MALEVGTRLGHYDVTALIGEGGMGQVHQSTDTKLNRAVAVRFGEFPSSIPSNDEVNNAEAGDQPDGMASGVQYQPGIEVTGAQRVLYLSGQTANAADGTAMHPGDLVAQFRLAWSNLKDALAAAGMDPTNIVRLNMYTTDVDGFMGAAGELVPIFAQDGCKPVSTLLGVARLFEPEIMVELEATAVA